MRSEAVGGNLRCDFLGGGPRSSSVVVLPLVGWAFW